MQIRPKAEGRAGVERTRNIRYIDVTLEVFQLEMSALKFCKSWKSPLMSVMAETSQSAMGPHVAVAAVGLVLKFWTAVIREALVVKIQAEAGGGLGEGNGGEGGGTGGGEGDGGMGGGGVGGGGVGGGEQLPDPQLEP